MTTKKEKHRHDERMRGKIKKAKSAIQCPRTLKVNNGTAPKAPSRHQENGGSVHKNAIQGKGQAGWLTSVRGPCQASNHG